jgi:hypothetical protein
MFQESLALATSPRSLRSREYSSVRKADKLLGHGNINEMIESDAFSFGKPAPPPIMMLAAAMRRYFSDPSESVQDQF